MGWRGIKGKAVGGQGCVCAGIHTPDFPSLVVALGPDFERPSTQPVCALQCFGTNLSPLSDLQTT